MHVVIIGNGIAGITAARTLKKNKINAKVSIYTSEKHMYYPRPRLYELLSGETKPQQIYAYSPNWYISQDLQVHLNCEVRQIMMSRKELLLQDQSKVDYDRLLLATGSHPFIPSIKGIEKKGVFTFRSIDDVIAMKKYLAGKNSVIIIGCGLLGLELAVELSKLNLQVKVIEHHSRLLPRHLDQDGTEILKMLLETHGIEFMLGVNVIEILGEKQASGILLDNGIVHSSNLIIISAGVRANITLALEAGIKVNQGVLVDKYMQTNINDVYAAGDVAEFRGKIYGIIPVALTQGKIAAMNLLGDNQRIYKGTIPSNLLRIVGIDLMSMGITNLEQSQYAEIKKIDKKRGIYKKLVLKQGKIIGAIIIGDKQVMKPIKCLIDQEVEIDKYQHRLLEDNFDYGLIIP
jgi:nitrite reductase (NADH) large subunit